MNKYRYTLMNRGKVVVRTNDRELAREGVKELGNKSYIYYTKMGREAYEDYKFWDKSNA